MTVKGTFAAYGLSSNEPQPDCFKAMRNSLHENPIELYDRVRLCTQGNHHGKDIQRYDVKIVVKIEKCSEYKGFTSFQHINS